MFNPKFFAYARTAAMCSAGVSRGLFRHGAVLVRRNTVISAGFNQYKTHPNLVINITLDYTPYLHAESHCLFKYGLDNSSGCDMYVIRLKRDNSIGLSKPCENCHFFIREANLRKVYYTTNNGYKVLRTSS
jgi:deoxycytidylate deaminase